MITGAITMVATEKGFTLIEVLVAMVVFSSALLGLARMQIAAIQVNTIASRLTQGTTLAQERAERLMALPYNNKMLADTTGKGSFTSYPNADNPDPNPPPQGYTIRWEVDTDAPSAGIKTINIFVTWKNKASQPKTFSLSVQKSNV
jgi:prepilin-type N-terminal cleavage/methylation domain-containing protein